MPTGYTADVADGKITELAPFVMQLARGMGALITMRDAPSDAEIPDKLEPSPHYAKRVAEIEAQRDELRALSDCDASDRAKAAVAEFHAARAKSEQEHVERRNRYNAMLAKVTQWEGAPEGIKEFAIEQLRSSIDFDCREPFKFWQEEPPLDGAEWRETRLREVLRELTYYRAEATKEAERTDARNEWLRQLRASLQNLNEKEPA